MAFWTTVTIHSHSSLLRYCKRQSTHLSSDLYLFRFKALRVEQGASDAAWVPAQGNHRSVIGVGGKCLRCKCAKPWRHAQPPRHSESSLPELSYRKRVASDPRCPGIRSQSNQISVTRHAPVGYMHSMPRETCLHQRGPTLPGLSCRYSQEATGGKL